MFDRPDRIVARIKHLVVFGAALALGWIGIDALVYRSGLYYSIAAPLSNTGSLVTALMLLERQYRAGSRNVLVVGDSRIGEGFSARLAEAGDPRTNFINLSVPGSTPRTWYYLLRETSRRGYRPDAVVIGTPYEPRIRESFADWPLDPAQQASLLGLSDLRDYPDGFIDGAMRARARDAILLPALAMRQDTLAMLAEPLKRRRQIRKFRPGLIRSIDDYVGRGESMPTLVLDGDGSIANGHSMPAAQRSVVADHLDDLARPIDPAVLLANVDYMNHWFAAIGRVVQAQGARLIVFPLPRGPYGAAQPPLRGTATVPGALATDATAIALRPDLLLDLEQPQYFFDVLHLNGAGRERLSVRVGEEVRRVLDSGRR